jgi:hypothetical protein
MVPCDKQNYDRANEAINLAVAVEELLTLANKDIERIETELKCPATSKD